MIRTLLWLLPPGTRRGVRMSLVLTVLSIILRAAGAVLLVPIIGGLFGDNPGDAWPWVGAFTAIAFLGWFVDWVASDFSYAIGYQLLVHGQQQVADRLARVRLTWFNAANTATARQAIAAGGPDLVGLILYLLVPVLGAVLLPLCIAIALIPISWPLALAAFAGVPVLLGAYWATGKLSREADHAATESNSQLTERILEFARTQHSLRAARRVDPERSHVGASLATQHTAASRLLLFQIPGQIIFSVASQLTLLILAGATVILTVRGDLSAPQAIALIVVIVRYLEPFTVLAELSGGMEPATEALRRIKVVLEAPETSTGTDQRDVDGSPEIQFSDVSFSYAPDDRTVLNGIDLHVKPGTTTAIVGPSGSGKSTVLALLAGLQQPTKGSIQVDGRDTATFTEDVRRGFVSVVFQEPYLFDTTIRDNVLVGQPSATDTQVDTAAQLARVDSIVERLPDHWDTQVGEAGGSLSGGERQRVSIARALLKPAPVLLVDEATSALDTENETAITAALTADPTPRTRVIVAHRLSSIRNADRVVFLEDGRVVEEGTVDELLNAGGRFAEFWQQQDASTGWHLGEDTNERIDVVTQ